MICTVDVDIQSSNPDFPLKEWKAFKGSPTSIRIRNVPRRVGAWDITDVNVKCVYPDNTAHVVAAVLTGCVWVATIPASDAVGFVDGGYSIEADGTDERGNVVTGYRLGEGKVTILDVAASAHAVEGIEFVRVFDTKPDSPRKGDFALDAMEIFDGTAWRTLGPTPDIGDLTRVEPYLYELNDAALDDTFAEAYFRERFSTVPRCVSPAALPSDVPAAPSPRGTGQNPSPLVACSCVRIGNEFARAYDWKYDESVSFLVRTKASGTRFASIAVCCSPEGLTRQALESKTAPANLFRIVPYLALDGINENGVTCCVNVVSAASPSGDRATAPGQFCAVGAVRRVLDRARTAEEGATLIATGAWMPSPESLGGYSLHFMIADAVATYIVEDGVIYGAPKESVKAMTNFRVGGHDFLDADGYADVDKIASYDPYGTGAERYNALMHSAKIPSLREWLKSLKYSDAYSTYETTRPSDFAGVEIAPGVRAKINDTLDIEEWFADNEIHAKWLDRTRDATFWQTVHSSVYDIAARSLQLVVQEGDAVHTFPLVKSDSEPADYSTVRTNAAAGAAHAAETGNPHTTTAEQVGAYTKSEVDEKISQNAAHYLTAKAGGAFVQFATHAALAAAKAAHTDENPQFWYGDDPHTPDKNDYCTVLDDETHGHATTRYMFVGEWPDGFFRYQYTVNPTALTQAQWDALNSGATKEKIDAIDTKQDALTTAQLDNIDSVPGKRDKTDMFTEWEIVWEGHDTPRTWHIVWNNDEMAWLLLDGSEQLAISFKSDETTSLDFGIIGDDHVTATRQRILTTSDVTDDLVNPTEGKAAEAAAVKTAIGNAAKLTPVGTWAAASIVDHLDARLKIDPEWTSGYGGSWTWTVEVKGGVYEDWYEVVENAQGPEDAKEITGNYSKVTHSVIGYTTANGEYVSAQTAADITRVAEAAVENKAVGEIEALNGKLVVKDDGGEEQFNSEKAVRYELASASSATFKDMAINYLVIAATESTDPIQQAVTIPTASVDGRAIDFIVDVTCNHAAGAVLQPSDSNIVLLPEADAVDNITIGGGERALITFTQLPGTKTFMTAKKVLVEPQEA